MEFIDFNNSIDKLRAKMVEATNALMKENSVRFYVSDEYIEIEIYGGLSRVKTIFYDPNTFVSLETTSGDIYEYADLATDDMVAIYEHIYNKLFDAIYK